ncbi:DUF2304 domain-containing protein [Specibacter sp. NPDC078709]|uniref:DUF2304 domain-containing protein n=1 Tax=Specibacter sp. NPDC078709 TaxID=3154364 RepID=UPI00343BB8B4
MKILIQIILIISVIVISLALMRGGSNARHLAVRRLLLGIFAILSALSIFFPNVLTTIAGWFGIGRGTDLVLYGTVVMLLIFMATTYQRHRSMEMSVTKLARRIAIDETPKPWEAQEK